MLGRHANPIDFKNWQDSDWNICEKSRWILAAFEFPETENFALMSPFTVKRTKKGKGNEKKGEMNSAKHLLVST